MKICVEKNTTVAINGPLNDEEKLISDALSAGFTVEQVEILTQDEYDTRKALEPAPTPQPSHDEILSAKIENQTINLLIDLGVI